MIIVVDKEILYDIRANKAAFFIERYGCSVCIYRDEAASTSAHSGENMLDLQKNRPAYLFSGVVFRDGKTTDFNCRLFLATFGVDDTAVKTVP